MTAGKRLSAIYNEAFVAEVAKELVAARTVVYANETDRVEAVNAIHQRFTYRMHDSPGSVPNNRHWFGRKGPKGSVPANKHRLVKRMI